MSQIWWCEQHEASGSGNSLRCFSSHLPETTSPCRMVPMLLVNPNSLVVEKTEIGEWPEWALSRISALSGKWALDALAGVDS